MSAPVPVLKCLGADRLALLLRSLAGEALNRAELAERTGRGDDRDREIAEAEVLEELAARSGTVLALVR